MMTIKAGDYYRYTRPTVRQEPCDEIMLVLYLNHEGHPTHESAGVVFVKPDGTHYDGTTTSTASLHWEATQGWLTLTTFTPSV